MTPSCLILSDLLHIKAPIANCMWDLGREELSALPYFHQAAAGDLVAIVRTFTTDPRPGVVMNDSHEPTFCIKTEDGAFDLLDYSQLTPQQRRIAGPMDTAVRTDPNLRSWVERRLIKRCPNITEYSETFEAFCFRDAVVLENLRYEFLPKSAILRERAAHLARQVDVAFPQGISNHSRVSAHVALQSYLSHLTLSILQSEEITPECAQVTLEPC